MGACSQKTELTVLQGPCGHGPSSYKSDSRSKVAHTMTWKLTEIILAESSKCDGIILHSDNYVKKLVFIVCHPTLYDT